ncbi:putative deaminase [Gordonia araii NBRC 100433]|uniref:Putative deaminase n=1 Tax=Gordonia araii NBRC 100433 TaxID=1073574 RepID=G7H5C9_9ACTN|nr:putative deaminase [Gordonia araii NBRC 100433]
MTNRSARFWSAVIAEDRNRIVGNGDPTYHPELTLAQLAARELAPEERAVATVYTSGEHCPMCSAAHAWVGLGRIVFASSSTQLTAWLAEFAAPPAPVVALPITTVAPGIPVDGPAPELAGRIRELHARSRR